MLLWFVLPLFLHFDIDGFLLLELDLFQESGLSMFGHVEVVLQPAFQNIQERFEVEGKFADLLVSLPTSVLFHIPQRLHHELLLERPLDLPLVQFLGGSFFL